MTHFPHRLNQLSTDLITFGVVVNTDWHPQNSLYQMLLTDPQYSHHTWRIASPCFVCWWSDDVQNLSCEFILWGTDKIRACQTDFCERFSDGCSSDMLIFTEAGGFRTKVTLATVMFRTRPAVQYDVTNFIAQKLKKNWCNQLKQHNECGCSHSCYRKVWCQHSLKAVVRSYKHISRTKMEDQD